MSLLLRATGPSVVRTDGEWTTSVLNAGLIGSDAPLDHGIRRGRDRRYLGTWIGSLLLWYPRRQ